MTNPAVASREISEHNRFLFFFTVVCMVTYGHKTNISSTVQHESDLKDRICPVTKDLVGLKDG